MEKNQLKLWALAAALILALPGCAIESDETTSERVASLKREGAFLQEKLDRQAVKMDTEVRYLEQQASLAAGCDFLLPLCPAVITRVGHQAQATGYSGGTDWPFWLALLGKLAGVGSILGALWGAFSIVWARWGRPTTEAVAQAAQMVATAEGRAAAAEDRVKAAEARAQQAKEMETQARARAESYEAKAAEIDKRVQEAQVELVRTTEEIENVRAARDALAVLNI